MATPRKGPRMGRDPAHQRLILANLAASLFAAEAIVTTEAKAKELIGKTDLRVGVVQLLFPKRLARTGLEFPAYAAIGRSVGRTEEGETFTSFTFGVSVIKPPKGE